MKRNFSFLMVVFVCLSMLSSVGCRLFNVSSKSDDPPAITGIQYNIPAQIQLPATAAGSIRALSLADGTKLIARVFLATTTPELKQDNIDASSGEFTMSFVGSSAAHYVKIERTDADGNPLAGDEFVLYLYFNEDNNNPAAPATVDEKTTAVALLVQKYGVDFNTIKTDPTYQTELTKVEAELVKSLNEANLAKTDPVTLPKFPESVTLNKATLQLEKGDSETLTAAINPADAVDADTAVWTWTSSNETVATVSATGEVTAVAGGNATITAKATIGDFGDFTATCQVTVIVSVTGITAVGATDREVGVGSTITLEATIAPADATNKQINWTSDNAAVATVSAEGVVTGVALGTAAITATTADGNFTATFNVEVKPVPVTGVTVAPTTASVVVGGTTTLVATVAPEGATDKTVAWATSDAAVATVNNQGVVTAVAVGDATITVTTNDGSFTANCAVTVTAAPVEPKATWTHTAMENVTLGDLYIMVEGVATDFNTTLQLTTGDGAKTWTLKNNPDHPQQAAGVLILQVLSSDYAQITDAFLTYDTFSSITFADAIPGDATVTLKKQVSNDVLATATPQ